MPCRIQPQNSRGPPGKPIAFGPWSVMGGQPGSIDETQQMLEFAARHGVKPMIETFPMAEANRALEHTRQGRARFRAVLLA